VLNILLLTHDFGFPEGYAATLRARLMSRALIHAGASVRVICARFSEVPPDIVNTRSSGFYEGVEFRYTGGSTVRASSFVGRRLVDTRSLAVSLADIRRWRRAGELDAVYLYAAPKRWSAFTQTYVTALNAMKIPVVLEVNETPWPLMEERSIIEKRLSPLRGVSGALVISEFLEHWVAREAARLDRTVPSLRVPILVDADEARDIAPTAAGDRPFVVFACPPQRSDLFRFVIEAMDTVWKLGRGCDLVITGPSLHQEENQWLKEIVDSAAGNRGLGTVTWLGSVPRATLLGLYKEAEALLVPLAEELNTQARFPTKLGEYLVSGTPVVASDRGELRRFLRDGESVFLALPDGPEAFGRRIADALDDPVTAKQVAQRGCEVATQEFDYRRHATVLHEWFAAVAAR
jgi:glycosyltransferase involved in cell wall biosynthesis